MQSPCLFTGDHLRRQVKELGIQITHDYDGFELTIIGLLKGSGAFTADLVREIKLPMLMNWISILTYGFGSIRGKLRLLKDVQLELTGRDVLIFEDDILDTGGTLHWVP